MSIRRRKNKKIMEILHKILPYTEGNIPNGGSRKKAAPGGKKGRCASDVRAGPGSAAARPAADGSVWNKE